MLTAKEICKIEDAQAELRKVERRAEVRDLTERGIAFVREQVEKSILDSANSEKVDGYVYVTLGCSRAYDWCRPLFAAFLGGQGHDLTKTSYKWQAILKGKDEEHTEAGKIWESFVNGLVFDFKAAGFSVDCKPREFSQFATPDEKDISDMSVAALTEYPVRISWREVAA